MTIQITDITATVNKRIVLAPEIRDLLTAKMKHNFGTNPKDHLKVTYELGRGVDKLFIKGEVINRLYANKDFKLDIPSHLFHRIH